MTLFKKLLLLLVIGLGSTLAQSQPLIPGQIYNTGNLVNDNTSPTTTTGIWQNIGLWNQGLPCWGPGGPVYCGPNPYFNQGSFNFSYGLTDVYQNVNIANALPSGGSGLLVTGFNFGFTAKNGNGWDNGMVDYLTAYVRFYDKNGATVENYNYNLNYKFNWTNFNYNETFTTPRAAATLSAARYGFVGRDNNFWAGPYGPEITNVNFSLKYSVDPCFVNPLSNSSCPGFAAALAQLTPTSLTAPAETSILPLTISAPVVTETISPTPTTSTTQQPTTTTASVVSSPTTTNSTTVSTTNNTNEKQTSSSGLSIGLSVIAKNQERENTISALVVQNAVSTAAAASEQAQQEALSVASTAVTNSINSSSVAMMNQQSSISNRNGGALGSSIYSLSSLPGVENLNMNRNESFSPTPVNQSSFLSTSQSSSIQTLESYSTVPQNFLTDRSNPLNEIMEGRQQLPQNSNTTQQTNTVNKNASDNDVAGGVTVARIALSPVGYDNYLNLALKDVAFYEPKEVYKNQRNVDNVRVLRLMNGRSDRLHQDMVDQQYRK